MTSNLSQHPLDSYYKQVQDIILKRQDCISGLLPASTAITAHGNYTDAWVRDNVYSILAVWGLGLAYRRQEDKTGKAYHLEQSTVKLMRGLLTAMMRQVPKVEKFKHSQDPLDALHAKYDTKTGDVVVADHEWGHLQLDATSLFLLMLAQMTASGLRIVFTIDEVNFVQNLVHYICRAYRTPDYGIWERGNKLNHGEAELNASSIGMAKAAMEAMSGFNLFGKDGGQTSVVHIITDDIARMRIALESLLPRESLSKEVDSAVLSVTGFPAFAVDDPVLREKTDKQVVEKLSGRYGCKRFLRDGHQTVIEDHQRLHYEPHELKQFTGIECEWPLFFTYLLLNHLSAGNHEEAAHYRSKLETLTVEHNGQRLLPELYWVPKDRIEAEKANPHSQERLPNENIPLVWAQSLFILGCLLQDGYLSWDQIDPLGRRLGKQKLKALTIRIALLAENEQVKSALAQQGITTQTLAEIAPVRVMDANELASAYLQIGRNDRMQLSGRPLRQIRTLATSRLYLLAGEPLIFLPQFMNQKGFYLAMDNRLVVKRLELELNYIARHWYETTHPLMVILIKPNMLAAQDGNALVDFFHNLKNAKLPGYSVEMGMLQNLITHSCREKIDYLHDFTFSDSTLDEADNIYAKVLHSDNQPKPVESHLLAQWEEQSDDWLNAQLHSNVNLYAHLEILMVLNNRHGLDYLTALIDANGQPCPVKALFEEIYRQAANLHAWDLVRRCAGVLGKYDINLEQSATDMLVRQHGLTVGRAYSNKATLKRPADSLEILTAIKTFNNLDASEHILIQELIIYLGMLIKLKPELFADMHTIRVGHILQLIIARHSRKHNSLDQTFNEILALPPFTLSQLVQETLEDYRQSENQLGQLESLHYDGECRALNSARFPASLDCQDRAEDEDWFEWRERKGSVGRESEAFFGGMWQSLHHCKGLMIGEKLNSKRRLDSEIILAQMTPGEQSFKIQVNHLLNKIQAPVYRQLTVEALSALAIIFRDNPGLQIEDTIVTDILIGHAVKICWLQIHPEHEATYRAYLPLAWQAFYRLPPSAIANGILDAMVSLLDHQETLELGEDL